MHVLFICTQNQFRSPTAERIFANYPGIETKSAGIAVDANVPVSDALIEWAHLIFVMEKLHEQVLRDLFGYLLYEKRIVVLGIRDEYDFMDPKLFEILKREVTPYLEDALP